MPGHSLNYEPSKTNYLTSLFCLWGAAVLAILLVFSAGYDQPGHLKLRITLGFIVMAVFVSSRFPFSIKSPVVPRPAVIFLLFLCFVSARFLWGGYGFVFQKETWNAALIQGYTVNSLIWFFYFALFVFSSRFFVIQKRIEVLLSTLTIAAAFVTLNVLPPLLLKGEYGYPSPSGDAAYLFHPLLSSHALLYEYIFGLWSNMNWVGDFLAFGTFAGFGRGFYEFYKISRSDQYGRPHAQNWGRMLLNFCFSAVSSAAVFLLLSRGTIVFFLISLVFFISFLMARTPFRGRTALFIIFFAVFIGLAGWAGKIDRAVSEVQTIDTEIHKETRRSLSVNQEGARRALRMFQKYPLLGIGKDNYAKASEDFAAEGIQNWRSRLASEQCLSHYMQVLAEQGSGAFLYFLFLGSYVLAVLKGMWTVKSRFQMIAALALAAPVFLVLGHVAINDLMDRFSMPSLMFLCMGASLAVLSPGFTRENG